MKFTSTVLLLSVFAPCVSAMCTRVSGTARRNLAFWESEVERRLSIPSNSCPECDGTCGAPFKCGNAMTDEFFWMTKMASNGACEQVECVDKNDFDTKWSEGYVCGGCDAAQCPDEDVCGREQGWVSFQMSKMDAYTGKCVHECVSSKDFELKQSEGYACGECPGRDEPCDTCGNCELPMLMTFKFGDSNVVDHMQGDKAEVLDVSTGVEGCTTVSAAIRSGGDFLEMGGVDLNELILIDFGGKGFSNDLKITLTCADKTGDPTCYQEITITTTCEVPLRMGDRFGK